MRHVRILGLCLAAMFALAAVGAATASAEPRYIPETKEIYEHFKHCPVNSPEVTLCFQAISNGTSLKKGGQFSVGGITVPLNQVLAVQGGETVNEETGEETVVEPTDGTSAFQSAALRVPGGIARVKPPATWPEALRAHWKEVIKGKKNEAKEVFETPELVGKPGISRSNLLAAENTALEVPLRIHLTNPLGNLVGEGCFAGGPEEPIVQKLTSGSTAYDAPESPPEGWAPISGTVGNLKFGEEFQIVRIWNNTVVDNTYAVPQAHGCQTPGFPESEALVDEAIDQAFGLPAAAGTNVTEVKGTLWNATAEAVKAKLGE